MHDRAGNGFGGLPLCSIFARVTPLAHWRSNGSWQDEVEEGAGLGMLIGDSNVPVVPCAIVGAFQAMPPMANIPRPRRIRVRIGPFATQHAAATYRTSFEQKEHVVPFIVPPQAK